jgi:hypothetical protein
LSKFRICLESVVGLLVAVREGAVCDDFGFPKCKEDYVLECGVCWAMIHEIAWWMGGCPDAGGVGVL